MLDEQPDEPLHRSEGCAVDHDRAMRLVVGPRVGEVEPLGQAVVDLDRSQLPLTADDVLDHEIDLGPVKSGLAGLLVDTDIQ